MSNSLRSMHIRVPAKLNLFLHVTGQRSDGYHNLQSIFVPIDWYDDLQVTLLDDGQIERVGGLEGVAYADDLVIRAALALKPYAPTNAGARIELRKHIPSGAGMGGGSANAAYTLLALRQLWAVKISDETFHSIALSLGADVPFFLSGGPAWVEGIGEHITPIELPEQHAIVVKPADSVATPSIFKSKDLTRDSEHVKMSLFGFASPVFIERLVASKNDLQAVAERLCPSITQAIQLIEHACTNTGIQCQLVRMTGSGSAVFAIFNTFGDSNTVCDSVQSHIDQESSHYNNWRVRQCVTLSNTSLASQMVRS